MTEARRPIVIDMRCCCDALLYIEVPFEWASTATYAIELAKAWTAAHKAHHDEPRKEGGT